MLQGALWVVKKMPKPYYQNYLSKWSPSVWERVIVRELQQITSVSLLSSHSVTDDANNEHFILSRSTSSHTTEMKYIGCDELQDSDLSWQANRINTNEQLADVALINRSETKDELVQCVWTRFKTLKALD